MNHMNAIAAAEAHTTTTISQVNGQIWTCIDMIDTIGGNVNDQRDRLIGPVPANPQCSQGAPTAGEMNAAVAGLEVLLSKIMALQDDLQFLRNL